MTNSLSAATCAIYVALAFPVLYLLIRDGRYGLLGWLFLFFFCTLRMIGGALAVNDTSVSLSPLLTTASILHLAQVKVEWLSVLAYQMLIIAGVAITAADSAKLQEHKQLLDKAETITRAGISILAVAWGFLVGWTGFSFIAPRGRNSSLTRAGKVVSIYPPPRVYRNTMVLFREQLLMAVAFSLVFIEIRVFYSVTALCTQRASLNPVTGLLVISVVLRFLPEVFATLVCIFAGISTQGAALLAHVEEEKVISVPPKPLAQPWI
ncbi:uncharacterized protein N7498_006105 [Penicillium cinerascens]|uniref:DUF7702 domain-containing protein n=1 Tax=Penicillium cinerascens TaxID=70096 RepID=A0A9W9MHX6_9EURO|nr:uncharacterized protein N7498_006105 [Penicillium cinerascens]KAJ5201442.1 hypothetical protein N7498_006105 [Penicillium cinerascens]